MILIFKKISLHILIDTQVYISMEKNLERYKYLAMIIFMGKIKMEKT